MDDRVIPGIMNDVLLLQGRYPENFVLISQFEVCQEGGVKKGGTWEIYPAMGQRRRPRRSPRSPP